MTKLGSALFSLFLLVACVVGMPSLALSLPSAPQSTSTKSACSSWLGWDDNCLLRELRDPGYFGISTQDVSDEQLLPYITKNRATVVALLLQIDYGNDVTHFLGGNPLLPSESDFVGALVDGGSSLVDKLSLIADALNAFNQSIFGELTSESLSALNTVLQGIQVYRLAAQVTISQDVRATLDTYRLYRHDSNFPSDQAWSQIQSDGVYDRTLQQLSQVKKIPQAQLGGWFENAYVAYREVGYPDSADLRQAQGHALATLINPRSTVAIAPTKPPSTPVAGERLYIPSYAGLGLIELNLTGGITRRIAKTALFNNSLVVWNPLLKEFYVVADNGSVVSIVEPQAFREIATMSEEVGWNTNSMVLSGNGKNLYLGCSSGSQSSPNTRVVVQDTATRKRVTTLLLANVYQSAYLALAPDDSKLYVSWADHLDVYATAGMRPLWQHAHTGWQAAPLAISRDGAFLYLVQSGKLVRWRTATHLVDAVLSLPETTLSRSQLQLSSDGTALFVPGHLAIYRVPMTMKNVETIRLPIPSTIGGFHFAQSSDGRTLFVLSGFNQAETLWAINEATRQVTETVTNLPFPASVLVVNQNAAGPATSAPPAPPEKATVANLAGVYVDPHELGTWIQLKPGGTFVEITPDAALEGTFTVKGDLITFHHGGGGDRVSGTLVEAGSFQLKIEQNHLRDPKYAGVLVRMQVLPEVLAGDEPGICNAHSGKQAVPRSSIQRDEHIAVSSLWTISAAVNIYMNEKSVQTAAPTSLRQLGPPPAGASPAGYASLIDGSLASGIRSGYHFVFTPGPTGPYGSPTYSVRADPVTQGVTGRQHYLMDNSGVHRSTRGPAGPADEQEPLPCQGGDE